MKRIRPSQYGDRLRFVHGLLACACLWFAAAASHPAAAQARPVQIVAFGDSLSAGYQLPERAAFPTVLERVLREGGLPADVSNAGVSGDTSSNGLERLDWAIGPDTDIVILELGANDMLRGLNPDITYKSLSEIMARLQGKKIKVLLAGMIAAPGIGSDYEAKFNAIYTRLAKEFSAPLYPFFLQGVAGNPKLQLADGMHPNGQGVEIIAKGIAPMVRTLAASAQRAE